MTGRRKPVRVRRARQYGLCAGCGGPILIGQQIAQARAGTPYAGWVHVRCHIKAQGTTGTTGRASA
jgi:hypothetical protein